MNREDYELKIMKFEWENIILSSSSKIIDFNFFGRFARMDLELIGEKEEERKKFAIFLKYETSLLAWLIMLVITFFLGTTCAIKFVRKRLLVSFKNNLM